MNQQINLYQPIFRKQRKVFSSSAMLQVCGIMVLSLGIIYGYGRFQVARLTQEVGQVQTMQQQKTQRLVSLGREFPPRVRSRRLEAEVALLQTEARTKRRVLAVLSNHRFGNTSGFSAHLKGLARREPRGVWLTDIVVAQGGTRLDLAGSTLEPALVPRFLGRLAHEPAFHGRSFRVFRMSRADGSPGWINFTLQTDAHGKAPG
ncbi:MAG: hypothetical protein B7Z66_02810 [Chromatiales bacterium 21-64-14]|nr:MAG: hypothetical protein B7Z66_02810 [Chromatiales bacterium 21-64-14]HQU14553.1 PilN domain-containing protein [Gammaproteobacteria bacterium]